MKNKAINDMDKGELVDELKAEQHESTHFLLISMNTDGLRALLLHCRIA